MKRLKCAIGIVLILVMLFSSCSLFLSNRVWAAENDEENTEVTTEPSENGEGNEGSGSEEGNGDEGEETEDSQEDEASSKTQKCYAIPTNKFEISEPELLHVYAGNSTGGMEYPEYRHDINTGVIIPVREYLDGGVLKHQSASGDSTQDGLIDATDASWVLQMLQVHPKAYPSDTISSSNENWEQPMRDVIYSLQTALKDRGVDVSLDEITINTTTIMPSVEKYNIQRESFTINSVNKITTSIWSKIEKFIEYNETINIEEFGESNFEKSKWSVHQVVSLTAVLKNGAEYKLVIGNDNNFYLLETKSSFQTELTYRAEDGNTVVEGKMDGNTFLPPYYEDEDKDEKKDTDAIAIIKSKTDEDIVKTNGVAMIDKANEPNSEGWYYPDINNKKVIEKKYPFDKYDNINDNGMVNETVNLTGANGGEHTQRPSIKWTFRRIDIDEKENNDGSITVTISYNLPVDINSIPDGWEPVYDDDGVTVHKIRKTIKKGENYDKDVTVKQNGTDATVTTHVTIKWPSQLPKAGDTIFMAIIGGGLVVFAVSRRRKLRSANK